MAIAEHVNEGAEQLVAQGVEGLDQLLFEVDRRRVGARGRGGHALADVAHASTRIQEKTRDRRGRINLYEKNAADSPVKDGSWSVVDRARRFLRAALSPLSPGGRGAGGEGD